LPLAKRYPRAEMAYRAWAKQDAVYFNDAWDGTVEEHSPLLPFALGETQFVRVRSTPEVIVCNMCAQTLGGKRPLYYNHLAACMNAVGKMAINARENFTSIFPHFHRKTVAIHTVLFGAGLAGGNWDFIKELIEDAWIKRDIPVTVYCLPQFLPPNFDPKQQ
jgi:hypothetical protein